MSIDPSSGDPLILTDTEAREWYTTRRGGGHLLDAHIIAINERFGPNIDYSLRAPIDPLTGKPSLLIIEIDLPVSEDDSWEALEAVQSDLLDQRENLRQVARRKDPFANIVITLAARAETWDAIRQEIEDMG